MSEFDYDDYAAETPEYVDPAMAQQIAYEAAARAAAGTAAWFSTQQQQATLAQESAISAAAAKQADESMGKRFGAAWDAEKRGVAEFIAREPQLVKEEDLFDPDALERSLERSWKLSRLESAGVLERQKAAEDQAHFDELLKAHRPTYASFRDSGGGVTDNPGYSQAIRDLQGS